MTRQEQGRIYQEQAGALRQQIGREVRALRPMGRMSELAMVVGAQPRRGVAVDIPGCGQAMVFAKARQPSAAQLEAWRVLNTEADALLQQAARMDYAPIIIGEHRTIGNRRALEWARELQAQGWTTPEEDVFIARLEAFWATYPEAKSGLVTGDSIQPR